MRRRYASEQLQWLVRKSAGMAPPSYLAQLQHHILECDQKSRNANIPASAFPCRPPTLWPPHLKHLLSPRVQACSAHSFRSRCDP